MFRNRKSSVSRLALVVLILVLSALAAPLGARAAGTTTAEPPPAGSTTCTGCSFIGPYIDPNGGGTRS